MADLLAQLPSVTTPGGAQLGFNPATSEVNLRGLGSSPTLVLANGVRIGANGYSFPNARIADIEQVQQVDICGSGADAVYGVDAVAGVVNYITTTQPHTRGAFATENIGVLVNPAATFRYDLSGTGYGVSAKFCIPNGRILPYDLSVNYSGYNLSGSGSFTNLNFPEGLGITGIGGIPGIYVNSATDVLTGIFDAKRNSSELSLDMSMPFRLGVYGGSESSSFNPIAVYGIGSQTPSIGITSVYAGVRGGTLNQSETTQISAFTPAFGISGAWQGNYATDFKGNYYGAYFGVGYSRTFYGERTHSTSTTYSLVGTAGYDIYNFKVTEQVNATGLGGALNYNNVQAHGFSDSLFSTRLTAAVEKRNDNLTYGFYASLDCGVTPQINRYLPDSDVFGALDPRYSLSGAPSAEIGVFMHLKF